MTERRNHPRFSLLERAFVAVTGDDLDLPCHLIDISVDGMAFRYLNETPLPLTNSRMDNYLEMDLRVDRLPVEVITDKCLTDHFIPKRRCGVRFGMLTPAQKIQLNTFIECYINPTN